MQPQWIETNHHKNAYQTYGYVPGAIASGRFAFISGQVGIEEDFSINDDPEIQIDRAFTNLGEIIKAIPASSRDVIDITTYHVGLQKHLELVTKKKKEFFGDWDPAWTAIGITELGVEGLIIEIRAVVVLSSTS